MRGSPSLEFTVSRFGAWLAGVASLVAASLASLLAWTVASPLAEGPAARCALVVAGAIVVLLGRGLWRQPVVRLEWNGSDWLLSDGSDADASRAGRLEPMIDLGSFLLLRFSPSGASATTFPPMWIPVGRAGLESQWHAIRCAVHGSLASGTATGRALS